jgi:glutathione S-transferase
VSVDLFHAEPASNSLKVLQAIHEKGVGFVSHYVDLRRFEQHSPEFLKVNPAGQVPVLDADGRLLTESFFILQWLDETYPDPPLGGADPRARYAVHKWGKYLETHIAPNLALWRWAHTGELTPDVPGLARLTPERRALWQRAAAGFEAEEVARARAALEHAAARMEADLAAGEWLAGGEYTLADIALYPHVVQFEALDIPVPGAVSDWLDRVAARDAVGEVAGEMPLVATMGPEPGRWG